MKLRELETALSEVTSFESPKPELEQYPTSPHLAAQILHLAQSRYGDITDKVICDLGCGPGILSIGCACLGASHVFAVDSDSGALAVATQNTQNFEISDVVDLVAMDVLDLAAALGSSGCPLGIVDTVIMNPPFGTKRKGMDMAFLLAAFGIARDAVYSLHKSSTREHIDQKARAWGAHPEVLANVRFDISNMYQFHKERAVDVAVDLWRFDVSAVQDRAMMVMDNDTLKSVSPNASLPTRFDSKHKGRRFRSKKQ